MKIYTKTGDKGKTMLYGGKKVLKSNHRVEVYGNADELNSTVGVIRSFNTNEALDVQLNQIQNDLFNCGAELATSSDKMYLENGNLRLSYIVSDKEVHQLEQWIDEMEVDLEPLTNFILPMGTSAASFCHLARTVCRRTERSIVELQQYDEVRGTVLMYFNRLSDYLFVLSRFINYTEEYPETVWKQS